MKELTCEQVRELLPELAAGALPESAARAAERHRAACAACREDLRIITLIARAAPSVPDALEARVLAAVRRLPVRRAARRFPLAAAATVAAAVIGGALLIDGAGLRLRRDAGTSDPAASQALVPITDPLLGGGSLLPQLTETELQALLEEMDS